MQKKILQEAVVRRLKTIAEANSDYKYTFGNYEIELKNSQVYFKKNGMLVKVIDVNSTFGKYDFKQMAIKVAKGVGHSLTEDKADGYSDPAYRATIKQFKGKKVSKQEFAQALAMHHKSMNESIRDTLAELNNMTLGQLERIEDYAEMIADRMESGQQLDSWMFSQITVALDNLNAVHDAMDGEDGIEESQVNEKKITVVNEGKYYITRNLGRGQGMSLVKDLDKPKEFKSYKDAKKEADRLERGSRNMTAYFVSDTDMKIVSESVNEAQFKVGDNVIVMRKDGKEYTGKVEKLNPLKLRISPSDTMVIPNAYIKDIVVNEAAGKPGMWANIHAKRKRGEAPAKPGDPDRPSEKEWKDNTNESSLTSEGTFFRLPKNVIGNELYLASKNLTNLFNRANAGNDIDTGVIDSIVRQLNTIKKSVKKFNSAEEIKGTVYESIIK